MFIITKINSGWYCEDCGYIGDYELLCKFDGVKKTFCHDGHFGNGELGGDTFSLNNLKFILDQFTEEFLKNKIKFIDFTDKKVKNKDLLYVTIEQNGIEKIFEYCLYDYDSYECTEDVNLYQKLFKFLNIDLKIIEED